MTSDRTAGTRAADTTVIALVAVMILVGKTVLRFPIHLSGHAGVLWIAALLIGRGVVRRRGAATMMGLVGGLLVGFVQPNDAGLLFTVAKYVVCGAALDVLTPLLGGRLDRLLPAVVAGATAHAAKVAVDLVQGLVAGVPASVLAPGLTVDLVLHIGFGVLAGLIAVFVLRALTVARIPQLAALEAEAGT
jgi:hypothetical protein